jgi:molecular chaperone DnaK (HSP70)
MSTELSIKALYPVIANTALTQAEGDASNTTFVGIDFGTSTTVVSIALFHQGDQPISVKALELRQKYLDGSTITSYKVPSIIAWKDEKLLFGEGAAQLKYRLKPGINLWHSFKMELGEDVGSKYPSSELGKNQRYTILNPVDATIYFFKFLKLQIEKYVSTNHLPGRIAYAVSIPASFEANQRRDLVEALETNGFQVNKQSLIDEPNAAFLSVVSNPSSTTKIQIPDGYNPYVLVFDFGAGTCDISILEVGQDNNGFFSKNIAISKFEQLGGNNIDRLIAIDILLPQLLKPYRLESSDFRTRELKELIIPSLLHAAENLKIRISEEIALKATTQAVEDIIKTNKRLTIGANIEIDTRKGLLKLEEATLSYAEFAAIIESFTLQGRNYPTKRVEQELAFISVFSPIDSALKKANLTKDDIDYLLFIGGSSKNVLIQKALRNYLSEADALIPPDLQAHVSAGAAIHSLIFNGFGKNLIQPITSEPIFLIVKDEVHEQMQVLVGAGTVIPCELMTVTNLTPQREGQKVIELPICVGSKNKLLYNIKVSHPGGEGFSKSAPVRLDFEINADKMLIVRALVGNKAIEVEPLSPFANSEVTTEERIKLRAEREFNLECQRNGGEPTLAALRSLYDVYNKIGLEFKAAETLEQIEEMFPGKGSLNSIGLHYSNSGKPQKALHFYKKSFEKSESSTVAFNIAQQYKHSDPEQYKTYLEKANAIDPNSNTVAYELGKYLVNSGQKEKGDQLIKGAFERWKRKFAEGLMETWDYSWFSSCAEYLGESDLAEAIRKAEVKKEKTFDYNSENLTMTRNLDQGNLQID